MDAFNALMDEYCCQMKKGHIPQAYKGLMDYILKMKTYLKSKHPDYLVPGSIYFGYMDMTYFSFTPPSLKDRNLKIAVVFVHETCRFEAWLAAVNKLVQKEYWNRMRMSGWNKYRLVPDVQGNDAILEHILVGDPDFSNLDALTNQIEKETLKFVEDVETFLSEHNYEK